MKPTLLVLAAGMGSRYGGLKQIDGFGPNGETIIEYSVYDAIRAGFGKVVFVIRREFEDAFREKFLGKFGDKIEVAFAFQEINITLEGVGEIPHRTKPWGTAHAVLAADEFIDGPFAMINADDYYGHTAYQILGKFLQEKCEVDHWAMVGYPLINTLSDHGMVNRGIAATDENNQLVEMHERLKIKMEDGQISYLEEETRFPLKSNDIASMNLFGFHQSIFDRIREQFTTFVKANKENLTAEFYIPTVVNDAIASKEVNMTVLTCEDQWYGVTYKDDKPMVEKAIFGLVAKGIYPGQLWDFHEKLSL